MLKRFLLTLLLACFSQLGFSQSPEDSFQSINRALDELESIQKERDSYLISLENINSERLQELNERENDLKRQIQISLNLGNLIDDQAIYTRSLERKLKFYRTTTITVSVTLIAAIPITAAIVRNRR